LTDRRASCPAVFLLGAAPSLYPLFRHRAGLDACLVDLLRPALPQLNPHTGYFTGYDGEPYVCE